MNILKHNFHCGGISTNYSLLNYVYKTMHIWWIADFILKAFPKSSKYTTMMCVFVFVLIKTNLV